LSFLFFFSNDTATTDIYTLSLHDALPIFINNLQEQVNSYSHFYLTDISGLNAEKTSDLRKQCFNQDVKLVVVKNTLLRKALESSDRKSTRLNSSHVKISYAVFCLKKKNKK